MIRHSILRVRVTLLCSCAVLVLWGHLFPNRRGLQATKIVDAPAQKQKTLPRHEFMVRQGEVTDEQPSRKTLRPVPSDTTMLGQHQYHRVVCLASAECHANPTKRSIVVQHAERFSVVHRPPHPAGDTSRCEPVEEMVTQPTCNDFHMHDLSRLLSSTNIDDKKTKFGLDWLGSGGWRIAWKLRQLGGRKRKPSVVLKTIKWEDQDFADFTYSRQIVDAIATEAKTSKDSIINIYGFCGMSVYNELADQSLTQALPKIPLSPQSAEWQDSWPTRLAFAQAASHAVADLHESSAAFPIFVHRDLKTDNFVLVGGETLKLNDLNDAEILQLNTTDGSSSCLFRRRRWSPYYKSPEEAREYGLTAALDIFGLGGVLFHLTTGRRPYHDLDRLEAFKVLMRFGHDTIPDEYRYHADTSQMMRLIEWTWRTDPHQRPTALQVASAMDQIVSWYNEDIETSTGHDSV